MALDRRRGTVDNALAALTQRRQLHDDALKVAQQGLKTLAQTQVMLQGVAQMTAGLNAERRAMRRPVVCVQFNRLLITI